MKINLLIPSPVQRVAFSPFIKAGVSLYIKRDDLIHPAISGNKWRKLKYNLSAINEAGQKGFVTFGGAFSNHLAASAYAAALHKLNMVAVVRGYETGMRNPTLDFLEQCGVHCIGVSRSDYTQKNDPEFLSALKANYPEYAIIPEGGANNNGLRGCMEIMNEVDQPFDIVAAPLGSATTFSGLLLSGFAARQFLGFPAVKGGAYLKADVNNFIAQAKQTDWLPPTFTPPKWRLVSAYHFGGFGKANAELIGFMNRFYAETDIPLDPIYTGKMLYGLTEMAKQGKFIPGTQILALHTGGLQGIIGMNQRLRNKKLRIDYEEVIAHPFPPPPH